jgi:branched-chain amino acid aminotransferase
LRGITRDSVVALLGDRGIKVEQRKVSLAEVREAVLSGEITEVFACGTAAVITPVGVFRSEYEELVVGGNEPGDLTVSIRTELTGIQYGLVPDRHGWMRKLAD